ncbi:2Fe-2S iron-sulfur cluster-binding protein [Zoogloea sp. LCSB751]|uniref:2Fe-2S iron-sulfur cluster-binding protein n=1 Tax=Zoogloea sp. LCSB751 TaxID=1965277 RepID=UPI0009A50DC8|nr:2Fe-2S iron-sulfur cluster-binding protein [Zoogloea sp. LCSB751]
MPTLTFIEHNGTRHQIHGEVGQSVMQAATFAMLPGIQGDCGGACSCATCHAYVDEAWADRFPSATGTEDEMLDNVTERRANSRLSCQLVIEEGMDGLLIHLPASQY